MKFQKVCMFVLVFLLLFCTACGTSQENDFSSELSSPAPSAQNDDTKSIEDTVTYGDHTGAKWEYTVQNVTIYDNYAESGIPEDAFFEGLNNEKLVMVELKIKKLEGPQRKNNSEYDTLEYIKLANKNLLEAEKNNTGSPTFPDLVYFSGHEDGTGTYQYWLDPGEEAVFQLGWCLSDGNYTGKDANLVFLTDTEGLVLCIRSGLYQGEYIDLAAEE